MAHKDKHKGKPKKPRRPKKGKVGVEFLVAARDLDSGYKRGDPITVQADGHVWGAGERLPDFWIIKVPISLADAQAVIGKLWEAAVAGDEAFEAPDFEDRRIRRHRTRIRVFVDDLPRPKRNDLSTIGITTLSLGQARSAYRKLAYNRSTGQVEDTGQQEF